MRAKVSVLLPALALLISCAQTGSEAPANADARTAPAVVVESFDPSWAVDPLWDDGQAEVALYQAQRPQYGKIESYQAVFIVTKEDFNPKLLVKADPPYQGKPLLPVLKLNAVHSYWTPNYPYHFLASVFVRRSDPTTLVKLTVGSQEWCGNTFKEVKNAGAQAELNYHSYFDGEGDGTRALDLRPGDLLEDQLPLALRGLEFAPGREVQLRILPSLISNSLRQPPQFVSASVKVVGEETLSTPAGSFSAWKVNLKMGDLEQTWWFEQASPHMLLKMESSDGRAWLLKDRTRKPYWQTPTYQPEV